MANQDQTDEKKLSGRERRQRENEQNIFENWQSARNMGMKKYLLRHGVLTWGVSTFIVYWILVAIMNQFNSIKTPMSLPNLIFTFLMFAVFGLIYGALVWRRNERIFKKKYPYGRKK